MKKSYKQKFYLVMQINNVYKDNKSKHNFS